MAEEVKATETIETAEASPAQEQPETKAQMVIDMDEPMANHKITPALLEMTEEWKKSKLDEIKKQMKA